MAGGGGTRFWPLSRKEIPKQLLNLSGKGIMVNETIDRMSQFIEKENIFIVTNVTQAQLMLTKTEGRIQRDHILAEPAARNTAACIGYAAIEILNKYGDGIMCIVPSDHYIEKEDVFADELKAAMTAAEVSDKLVTIGITPTFPSTGYGYIKYEKDKPSDLCSTYFPVQEFVEKPDLETAEVYVEDGSFLWNSGMFVWKASTILRYFETLLPDIYACLLEIADAMNTEHEQEVIDRVYPTIPKISIDYGIMERAEDVIVLKGDFGWNDVGSFETLESLYEKDSAGNVIFANGETPLLIDTQNCTVYAEKRLIATIGVENLIVVETEDAVLVADKNRAQDVKMVVDQLKELGKDKYL